MQRRKCIMLKLAMPLMVALLVCSLPLKTASAQKRGFRFRGATRGMAWLFRTKEGGGTIGSATQLELKTNPEQMQLIIALMNDLQEQIQNTYAAGPDNGPEASAQLSKDEVRRMVRDINVSGEEVLSVILDSKQYARARQLMWQYIKYRAFERVDFVKEMKLTKKQKTAIAKIMKKQTITADDEDDISDLLTTDQHKQWLELKGPVFSYFARRRLPEAG